MRFLLLVIICVLSSYDNVEAQVGLDVARVPEKKLELNFKMTPVNAEVKLLQPLTNSMTPQALPPIQLPEIPLGFFCKFEDKLQQNWKIPINFELK